MAVDAGLPESKRVDELDADGALELLAREGSHLHVAVLEQVLPADLDAIAAEVLRLRLIRQRLLLLGDELAEDIDAPLKGHHPRQRAEQPLGARLALGPLAVQLRVAQRRHEPKVGGAKGAAGVTLGQEGEHLGGEVAQRAPLGGGGGGARGDRRA